MVMSKSSKSSKEYSREEKLAILKEAAENGVKATLEKHSLLSGTYYYWKKTLQDETLSVVKAKRKELEKQVRHLRLENRELKLMLAEEQLRSRLKSELLEKKRSSKPSL